MRRPAVVLLLGALLALIGVWGAAPAQACDCSSGTTVESAERAEAVFTGRLVERGTGVRPPQNHPSTSPPAVLVFDVETVVKGQVQERQEVLSPWDGASCGLELQPGGGPVAVFAHRDADLGGRPFAVLEPGQYASLLCDGNAPLTPQLRAELDALQATLPAAGMPAATPEGPGDRTGPVLAGLAALAALVGVAVAIRRRRAIPRP